MSGTHEGLREARWLHLARVLVECESPLSIGTGASDGVFDVALVRDANGLPAVPGSSLAGVLRHACAARDPGLAEEIFGFQRPRAEAGEGPAGRASRLHVSWGCIVDGGGRAVEGLLLGEAARRIDDDELLRLARATAEDPVYRDRVRLGHRGAADGRGKFDRSVLPAGYRFAFELSLWSARGDDPAWELLLALLCDPLLRLGGGTRAGLGALRVVRLHEGRFDLASAAGRERFLALGRGIDDLEGLDERRPEPPRAGDGVRRLRLRLRPRAGWRVGEGEESLVQALEGRRGGKPPDNRLLVERRVEWDDAGRGRFGEPRLLLPASGLKGALAHRIAFHDHRLRGEWAEDMPEERIAGYDKGRDSAAVRELFGYAHGDAADAAGRAGRVLVDDAWCPVSREALVRMMHNSIDRFTGGVRRHILFEEELAWGGTLELGIAVLGWDRLDPLTRRAFDLALADLLEGRLAVGGGTGKGHGLLDGEILEDSARGEEAAA